MQLISEAYFIMKKLLRLSPVELHEVFTEWNRGELESYLIAITSEIFTKKDPLTGHYLVDMILDTAGQKETGKWTSQTALELGVSTPTITMAVYERYISERKEERIIAGKSLSGPGDMDTFSKDFTEAIRRALYAGKICAYAQGFGLLRKASEQYGWDLRYADIAKIFRGGCIIRAQFLNQISRAFDRNQNLRNILLDEYFRDIVAKYQVEWREVVKTAISEGIAIPALSSALAYYDSYRSEELPMNLLQAQRDYFGAHTYRRIDKEGIFHTVW
jgi:6-phosphogluconate dehydrogenase